MLLEEQKEIEKRKNAAREWAKNYYEKTKDNQEQGKSERALAVIALSKRISDYLAEFDPMALEQTQKALEASLAKSATVLKKPEDFFTSPKESNMIEEAKQMIESESDSVKLIESIVFTLYDDERVKKKLTVMNKWEAMLDDCRNPESDFAERIEEVLQQGKSYKITMKVEEVPFVPDPTEVKVEHRQFVYPNETRGPEGVIHRAGDVVLQVKDHKEQWRDLDALWCLECGDKCSTVKRSCICQHCNIYWRAHWLHG